MLVLGGKVHEVSAPAKVNIPGNKVHGEFKSDSKQFKYSTDVYFSCDSYPLFDHFYSLVCVQL